MRIKVSRKVDFAEIMKRPTQRDLDAFAKINQTLHIPEDKKPNLIRHIFKNRRGEYTSGKLWCRADLGICRIVPLFYTTNDYTIVPIKELDVRIDK